MIVEAYGAFCLFGWVHKVEDLHTLVPNHKLATSLCVYPPTSTFTYTHNAQKHTYIYACSDIHMHAHIYSHTHTHVHTHTHTLYTLHSGLLPHAILFLRRAPVIGHILNLPLIKSVSTDWVVATETQTFLVCNARVNLTTNTRAHLSMAPYPNKAYCTCIRTECMLLWKPCTNY